MQLKLDVIAIGRLKAGPERELAERYRDRVAKAGRAVGLAVPGGRLNVPCAVAGRARPNAATANPLRIAPIRIVTARTPFKCFVPLARGALNRE